MMDTSSNSSSIIIRLLLANTSRHHSYTQMHFMYFVYLARSALG